MERPCGFLFPDFVIAYPKKYKSYNFSRQECKKQGFSRIGGRACYFTRLFARLPKQQKQPLIIKYLQTYFEKVTKSGEAVRLSLFPTGPYRGALLTEEWASTTRPLSHSALCPVATIEVAVADGFGKMARLELFAAFDVGDGASHLQDAIVGTGGEVEALHRHAQ